jgi:hypothetical protein
MHSLSASGRHGRTGVAEVVRQGDGLGQILVEVQRTRDRAGDLGHLQAVGQPRAEVIALMVHEHLGLVFETPEGGGVDDAIAVPLKFIARLGRVLRDAPSAGNRHGDGVGRQIRHASAS